MWQKTSPDNDVFRCTTDWVDPLNSLDRQSRIDPSALAWRLYKRRAWIEELFGDLKGNGFDLEKTRLRSEARLSRLMLAVSLVYLWLVAIGEHVWSTGLGHEVDRNDRRDLSIFRLGWDYLDRCLALSDPIPDCFRPNFCLVSGS